MMYVGIQLKDGSDFGEVEKALKAIGVNDCSNYSPNESGIYGMGMKQKYLVELSEFSTEELEAELRDRD